MAVNQYGLDVSYFKNCIERDAELSALKAQEPVAVVSEETFSSDGTSDVITCNLPIGMNLYAAPVAKQVVMPERRPETTCATDDRMDIGYTEGWNACLDEVAHLNAGGVK